MAIRYYDHTLAQYKVKTRYKWAAWAFIFGMFTGMFAAHLM